MRSACGFNAPTVEFNINGIKSRENYFTYVEKLNGEKCSFKVDTGSDISILNISNLVSEKKRIFLENCCLRYPTGERVPIDYKVKVNVHIGDFSFKTLM